MPKKNEAGKRHGLLTVLYKSLKKNSGGHLIWFVQCDCGSEPFEVYGFQLRQKKVVDCGCVSGRKRRRSYRNSKTYHSWRSMKDRCLNPENKNYLDYRKVSIDKRWVNDFKFFLEDMGEQPDGTSLDRIDDSLGYCKDNCRWTVRKNVRDVGRKKNRSVSKANKIFGD